ncbi:hypothetical protein Dimus_039402 [Dionaea muscipula]
MQFWIFSPIIYLIPKMDTPSKVSDFKPIACCTTIYKIIAKLLCGRLKEVLPSIIDQAQCAFVEGRSIVDNILLCQELMAGYDRKGISPRCVAKIDLRKAYGSVSWCFVERMLVALQFPCKFTGWILSCISSPYFTFTLNGGLYGFFKGMRGLRQGDPLFFYVFVVVMEYFSRRLRMMSKEQDFRFHPYCKKLGIVHLCFADDLMIVAKAHEKSLALIRGELEYFGKVVGLVANSGKSKIYFGSITEERKQQLGQLIDFKISVGFFKYLGVPLKARNVSIQHFKPLIEKITWKISCWACRWPSFAGRLQLVQVVHIASPRVCVCNWANISLKRCT